MEALLDAGSHRQEGASGARVLSDSRYLLVYDGDCGFCRASVAWALERDRRGLIDARAFQEEGVLERAGLECPQAERYAWLIGPEGRRWRGARAGAKVFRLLPGWGWAGRLLDLPGVRSIAARVYRWIADHRSFASSATGVGTSCGLEDPES